MDRTNPPQSRHLEQAWEAQRLAIQWNTRMTGDSALRGINKDTCLCKVLTRNLSRESFYQ
ncbi:hypothetical protein KIN20_018780 [Parelaphostrongylus tenuis]|uniref:Uncharacterized protein n=1 Tax=Parelaphostrongylus tenuis TaxID=148309 RepID=A0AAD5MNI4_PARTN|nr:hypothetical protein KIN20_018780 [Parelaphostrongylus tenuis]